MSGKSEFLAPRIIQLFGMVLLAAMIIFWGATGRVEPLLVATAGSLISGANLLEAYLRIKKPPPDEIPPAPAPPAPVNGEA